MQTSQARLLRAKFEVFTLTLGVLKKTPQGGVLEIWTFLDIY